MTKCRIKTKRLKKVGLTIWQVAEQCRGLRDITLARWLRSEHNYHIQQQPLVLNAFK